MLIGMVVGALAGLQVVEASRRGDLVEFLSPATAGWVIVASLIVLASVAAIAAPAFTRGFAPWVAAGAAWAAYEAAPTSHVSSFWPLSVLAAGMLAAYFMACGQRVVIRRPRTNSARVVRDFLRAYSGES
jgi:hypothetical protein